jgi:hypothetical protein
VSDVVTSSQIPHQKLTKAERDRESKRNYARRNREKHRQWLKQDSSRNPLKYILQKAKARAKRDGVVFDVTEQDFDHLPLYCPIFPNIKLIYGYGRGRKRQNDASATLDRIDNSRGYVRDNVVIISWRGNRLKNNSTPGELFQLATFYGRGPTANTILAVAKGVI